MKTTILKSVITVLVALFSLNAFAYDVEIDGIYYKLDTEKKTAEVSPREANATVNGNAYWGDVYIPESIISDGIKYSVVVIGNAAFINCSGLTSVTIPNSVTSIGNGAFKNCSGLTSLAIPNSVTSIGESAFFRSGLTSIDIPESITSISNSAFSGCNDLKSVTIPNSVKVIGNAAFQGCRNLASVTIPPSVTYIGGGAFGSTAWYTNQEDGLIYINNMVYRYKGTNPEKTDITIKEGIISICENAFYGCSDLTSISIPTSVTSIEAGAFAICI